MNIVMRITFDTMGAVRRLEAKALELKIVVAFGLMMSIIAGIICNIVIH